MSRSARQWEVNSIYHVQNKSTGNAPLFCDEKDKEMFKSKLEKYKTMYNFKLYAYVILDDEYHILLGDDSKTKVTNVSKIMQCLKGSFSIYINGRHGTCGSNFNGRFESKIIVDNVKLLEVSRKINLMGDEVAKHRNNFSSSGFYFGESHGENSLVDYEDILSLLSDDMNEGQEIYRKFCNEEITEEELSYANKVPTPIKNTTHVNRKLSFEFNVDSVLRGLKGGNLYLLLKGPDSLNIKAFIAFLLRSFESLKCKEISKHIPLIGSEYNASLLSLKGVGLLKEERFEKVYSEVLRYATSS